MNAVRDWGLFLTHTASLQAKLHGVVRRFSGRCSRACVAWVTMQLLMVPVLFFISVQVVEMGLSASLVMGLPPGLLRGAGYLFVPSITKVRFARPIVNWSCFLLFRLAGSWLCMIFLIVCSGRPRVACAVGVTCYCRASDAVGVRRKNDENVRSVFASALLPHASVEGRNADFFVVAKAA